MPAISVSRHEGQQPLPVATLLGHAHVDIALRCLGSLLRYSAEPLGLVVHDDGTLTESDRSRLAASLAEPRFIARDEADRQVEPLLARHPRTLRFRRENPLALKLLDGPLLGREPLFRYCDSDVLFLCPFTGLFELPPGLDAAFMADSQNAYSLRSWQLLFDRRLRLTARVNSGLVLFRQERFDLDRVEHVLTRARPGFARVWLEQTCWAALAGPLRSAWFDPRAVAFPRHAPGSGNAVAVHFVGPLRSRFEIWAAAESSAGAGAPQRVELARCDRCGAGRLAGTELRRLFRRLGSS